MMQARYHTKRQKRGGKGFSAQPLDKSNFSMELYYGDQLCSKCMTKSLVTYPVKDAGNYVKWVDPYSNKISLGGAFCPTFIYE